MKQGLLARKALLDAAAAKDTDGASAEFWLETKNATEKGWTSDSFRLRSNDFAAPAISRALVIFARYAKSTPWILAQ